MAEEEKRPVRRRVSSGPSVSNDMLTATSMYLDLPELLQLCATNKHMAKLCSQDAFWGKRIDNETIATNVALVPRDSLEKMAKRGYSNRQIDTILWWLKRTLQILDLLGSCESLSAHFTNSNKIYIDLELSYSWSDGILYFQTSEFRFVAPVDRNTCLQFLGPIGWEEDRDRCRMELSSELDFDQDEIAFHAAVQRAISALFWNARTPSISILDCSGDIGTTTNTILISDVNALWQPFDSIMRKYQQFKDLGLQFTEFDCTALFFITDQPWSIAFLFDPSSSDVPAVTVSVNSKQEIPDVEQAVRGWNLPEDRVVSLAQVRSDLLPKLNQLVLRTTSGAEQSQFQLVASYDASFTMHDFTLLATV
jgi:hypothetical protein